MGDNNLPAGSGSVPAGFYRKEDVVDALIDNFPYYPRSDHHYSGIQIYTWLKQTLEKLDVTE